MTMHKQFANAYNRGYQAALAGLTELANPYYHAKLKNRKTSPAKRFYESWLEGFNKGISENKVKKIA